MSQTIDPLDELAAMFLSSPAPVQHAQAAVKEHSAPLPRAMPRPLTDVLVVGNLPVRAGLWLTPYADAIAREHGCVGLIRLDGSEPSVQVLRGSREMDEAPAPMSLQQSIAELARDVNAWIVLPQAADNIASLAVCDLPQVTILTSADEAAVVAAYQLIKNLAQAAQDSDHPVPHVRLAVMGADQPAAEAIVERLNRTTVSFLGVEVRLACSLPRMDAGIRSTRYQSFAHEPLPALADVLAWIRQGQSMAAQRRAAVPSQTGAFSQPGNPAVIGRVGSVTPPRDEMNVTPPRPEAQPPLRPPLRIEEPRQPDDSSQWSKRAAAQTHREERLQSSPTPPPPPPPVQKPAPQSSSPSAAACSSQASTPAQSPMRMRPKPAMGVEAKDIASPREPDDHGKPVALASHVDGLTPLPVRMPGHESIELAVDAEGRMHALAIESSLRELRVVEAWAFAHRELIAMACPNSTIDQRAEVISHVFTDRPCALADLHGSNLRLHVRAPVVVNGQTGWYVAPLNNPR